MGTVKRAAWDAAHGPGRCVAVGAADFDPDTLDQDLARAVRRGRRTSRPTRRAAPRSYAPPVVAPPAPPPPVDNGPLWCLADRADPVSNRWIQILTAARGLASLAYGFAALAIVIAYETGHGPARPRFAALVGL